MTNKPLVLKHVSAVDVGVNEIIQRFSFNRNAERLLENDIALDRLYEAYLERMNIFEYRPGQAYNTNDIVWARRSQGDRKLFLLRCVVENNRSDLQSVIDAAYDAYADRQPEPEFEKNGWKDENAYVDIDAYGIDQKLRRYFNQQLKQHTEQESYHRFGKLLGEVDDKALLADLSNADGSRETVFYPYYTKKIKPNNKILYGFYRVWDDGTLEVDVVYRLGFKGEVQMDGYTANLLKCNDYALNSMDYSTAGMSKYFFSPRDRDIFAQGSSLSAEIDDILQVGRNDYVNVYTAEIDFPRFEFRGKSVSFVDGNYMIFGSDVMSQDADQSNGQIEPSANCMAYCNKTRRQFTAVYITYPDDHHLDQDGYNALKGGLVSNSFHCHVVGRWQEDQIQI